MYSAGDRISSDSFTVPFYAKKEEASKMYSGLNSDSLFLSDLKSLDEHSFDDSTRRMLRVRLRKASLTK